MNYTQVIEKLIKDNNDNMMFVTSNKIENESDFNTNLSFPNDDRPAYMTWANVSAKKLDFIVDKLRVARTALLSDCDWTQGSDSPLTTEKKTEWATYRQALRDLPSNYTTSDGEDLAEDLSNINWPTKP